MEKDEKNFTSNNKIQAVNSVLFSFTILQAFSISSAFADVSSRLSLSSNYLWRGVTQTDDRPAVSADVEYHFEQGTYVGLWTSNINYDDRPSYEVNTYFGHKFNYSNASIDLSARHYYFPSGGKYSYDFQPAKWNDKESSSFTEVSIGATIAEWNLAFSYSDNYLDSGFAGHYVEFNYTKQFTDDLSLKFHIGTQSAAAIDDIPEQTVTDHSITLKWRNISFTASDLDDNRDARQSDRASDPRYVLSWNMDLID